VRLGLLAQAGTLLAILLAVALAYSRTLNDWFVSDDFWYLRASQVAGWDWDYFVNSFDYNTLGPVPEFAYRPVYPIWFLFTYELFGLNPLPYKLFALFLHLFNTTLVWLVARKLTGRASVAAIAAFIFGIHPSYAAAVYWISSISVQAMAFSLTGVLLFLHYLDGGPRRWLGYIGSFLCVIFAMLLHPESIGAFGVMGLAYVLWRTDSVADLRSPRLYLPLVPHVIVGLAFLWLHQHIREQSEYQQLAFKFGPHMVRNYLAYVAYAGNPFDPTGGTAHWRAALPIIGVGVTGLYVLFSKSFDYRSRLLVLVWFAIAFVPLTTFTLNLQDNTRKLYFPGPAFALLIAMAAVSAWDWLVPRLRPVNPQALDVRYVLVACAVLLVAIALPLRTWQITDKPYMAEATLTSLDDEDYKAMTDQVRETYPTIPDGELLEVTGVPWTLLIFNMLDTRMSDALAIYYGDIAIIGYGDPASMAFNPVPHKYVVHYTCPPICGPPLPLSWIEAIQESTGTTPTDP